MNRPPANTGQRNGSFNGLAPSGYFIAYASENVKAFRPAPRKNSLLNASEPVGNSGFSVLQSVNFYAISLCNPFASALKLALNASSLSSSGFIVCR